MLRHTYTNLVLSLAFFLFSILSWTISFSSPSFAGSYAFSYSGRLVDATGRPFDGPVALKVSFFQSPTGTSPVLEVTSGLSQVTLNEGVFQITINLNDTDFQTAFPTVAQVVYIQITDLTHSPGQPYDRQQITVLPYAGKIPVDTSQFSWNSQGQLHYNAPASSSSSSSVDLTTAGPIGSNTPSTGIFTALSSVYSNTATSGSVTGLSITPTYNQASGTAANTDFLINRTETAVGSGNQRLIDTQVGSTSKFFVTDTGAGYFAGSVGIGTTSPTTTLDVNGNLNVAGGGFTSASVRLGGSNTGLSSVANYRLDFIANGTQLATFDNRGGSNPAFGVAGPIAANAFWAGGSPFSDTKLTRDAANVWAEKNGTNAQEFRFYNFDSTPNTEYASFGWINNPNVFALETKMTGTGSVRNIALLGGNVGIGNTSPNEKLEITGNTRTGMAPTSLTTTSQAQLSTDTTINVVSTTGYPSAGTLLIGSEAMTYTGTTSTTFTGLTRGALGTTAAAISSGATVNNLISTIQTTSTTPKVVVTGSGTVGIGAINPTQKLSVSAGNIHIDNGYGVTFNGDNQLYVKANTDSLRISAYNVSRSINLGFTDSGTTFYPVLNIVADGSSNYNVGIGVISPSYQLQLSTDSAAKPGTSTWTIASDARLKDVRAPFTRSLDALDGLHPIYFRYKNDNPLQLPSNKEYVGIIAQDAQQVIPEAVQTDQKGYLHVTNDAIIWTMLNGIKELYHYVTNDHLLVKKLEAENADLKARVERLEALINETSHH